ncbi:MAG: hypothetical protein WDO74_01355 [Pseudomonadota bacterium]
MFASSSLSCINALSAQRYITGLPRISGNTIGSANKASTGALLAISSATRRITVLQWELTMFCRVTPPERAGADGQHPHERDQVRVRETIPAILLACAQNCG